jgi:hypothetical protein
MMSILAVDTKGVPHTIEYPAVPIFHFLEESARTPDQPCTNLNEHRSLPGNEFITDHERSLRAWASAGATG